MPDAPAHSEQVSSVFRSTAAALCLLALLHGAVAECAGWQSTPEARRQCCLDGACPLHHETTTDSTNSARTAVRTAAAAQLTQADADNCCAQAEGRDASPSAPVFTPTVTLALLALPAVAPTLPSASPLAVVWTTPSPPTHVPKHLLLSVLLV